LADFIVEDAKGERELERSGRLAGEKDDGTKLAVARKIQKRKYENGRQ
jgi:hypothetical protein